MIDGLSDLLQRYLRVPANQTRRWLHLIGVVLAAITFVLTATILVAYDSVVVGPNAVASLQAGDIAQQDIRAPVALSYVSDVLTAQRRLDAAQSVPPVFFPPDPRVARQQTNLAHQILYFIENIRRDPFATLKQKIGDLQQIADLTLDEDVIVQILMMDESTWVDFTDQVTGVLERVMQGEIREVSLPAIRAQLPTQVSVRFSEDQVRIIVAIVEDLVRPNTLLNESATQQAREAAAANIEVRRSFERGQIVVRAGERIDEAAYEAMTRLGLLEPTDRRLQAVGRALLTSILVLVVTSQYIARFRPSLFESSRFMALLAAMFLVVLLGARISAVDGQIYLYPTAALALIYTALVGPDLGVIGMLGLAALVGQMQNNSLESTMLVAAGGLMAALSLRRAERLNGYFMPGLLVGLTNSIVITIFYEGASFGLVELIVISLLNGILSATVALGGLYIVTLLFNLPTGLKLIELSQPNQPLLQRLLREAPGTYQHSLQVANLAEQAANTIGANADLVRVAALYHDIGKMENAAFFTENQVEGVNPHDVLNDPYRSADIIISHVTDGDRLARQYRLPARFRDFILEHHGTQTLYFYEQALARAGAGEIVDKEQFTYPGPRPRTRETGILMLADSCEAAVRSRKPSKKQEIAETVNQIFESKIRDGQLDDCGLTLSDIKAIRRIFIDMLQAVFHPRISYPVRQAKEATGEAPRLVVGRPDTGSLERVHSADDERKSAVVVLPALADPARPQAQTREMPILTIVNPPEEDDESPLPDVPPLPRTGEQKTISLSTNGSRPGEDEDSDERLSGDKDQP